MKARSTPKCFVCPHIPRGRTAYSQQLFETLPGVSTSPPAMFTLCAECTQNQLEALYALMHSCDDVEAKRG